MSSYNARIGGARWFFLATLLIAGALSFGRRAEAKDRALPEFSLDKPATWRVDRSDFATLVQFMHNVNEAYANEIKAHPTRAQRHGENVAEFLKRNVIGKTVHGELKLSRIRGQSVWLFHGPDSIHFATEKEAANPDSEQHYVVMEIGKGISAVDAQMLSRINPVKITATVKEIRAVGAELKTVVLGSVKLYDPADEAPDGLTFIAAGTPDHTFTDVTGKHKIEAEFVDLVEGKAHLRRAADGKLIIVPMSTMSEADRAWIAAEMERRNAGEGK